MCEDCQKESFNWFHISPKIKKMGHLLTQWSALIIGIGSLIGVTWLCLRIGDWCRQYWEFLRKAVLIDGPPTLPFIGNGLYFIGDTNELLDKWMRLLNTYTTSLRVWLGPRLIVVISNPSDIEMLMKSPHGTYKSSEYNFIQQGTGAGLLTSSGPTHKIHRNLIMTMVNGKVLDTFLDSFEIQSRRCVECLLSHVDSEEFDIKTFIDNWSIDIVYDTIYGIPGTVQQGIDTKLANSILGLKDLIYERMMKVWLYPDWIYSLTRSGKIFNKAVTYATNHVYKAIAEKKQKYYDLKNSREFSDPEQLGLLDRLIAYNEEHKLMDDVRLRGELSTMFMAAHEPPALVSSFMLLMLAMHPEIQDKVRAEVQEVIGDENVTPRNASQLKYLEMVIKETIRLFPAGVMIMREAKHDIELSSFTAPKGCSIFIFIFKTHRDPKFWKEPNKFDPDRFLPENSVGRHPYAYLPFSSGPRGCIGKQFGMIMMKTLVSRVLQKYRLHSNGSLEKLRMASDLLTRSRDGYKVSITKL